MFDEALILARCMHYIIHEAAVAFQFVLFAIKPLLFIRCKVFFSSLESRRIFSFRIKKSLFTAEENWVGEGRNEGKALFFVHMHEKKFFMSMRTKLLNPFYPLHQKIRAVSSL